jgi:hypothetical protein
VGKLRENDDLSLRRAAGDLAVGDGGVPEDSRVQLLGREAESGIPRLEHLEQPRLVHEAAVAEQAAKASLPTRHRLAR